jgi:exodeoxyribonuclease VII large subunit
VSGRAPDVEVGTHGVAQVLAMAAGAVGKHMPAQLWVTGEVVSVTRSKAGHLYMTLAEGQARLSCAALGRDAMRVAAVLRAAGVELLAGVSVRLCGRLEVYGGRGTLELRVVDVDARVALGAHELARRALRAALEREGELGMQAALGSPVAPLHIGVVAPEGAGLGDLETLLSDSGWAFELRVVRAPAEGPTAPERIAASLALAASGAEVVILARGGGSAITLPYDAEEVVRAVARCTVPVVAALGHASDHCLADEVAWRSVPTPSAAASLMVSLVAEADRQVLELARSIAGLARAACRTAEQEIDRLDADIQRGLGMAMQPARVVQMPAPAPATSEARWRGVAVVAVVVALVLAVLVVVLVVL